MKGARDGRKRGGSNGTGKGPMMGGTPMPQIKSAMVPNLCGEGRPWGRNTGADQGGGMLNVVCQVPAGPRGKSGPGHGDPQFGKGGAGKKGTLRGAKVSRQESRRMEELVLHVGGKGRKVNGFPARKNRDRRHRRERKYF